MVSLTNPPATPVLETSKKDSSIQVVLVHPDSSNSRQENENPAIGICISHASLNKAPTIMASGRQVDAVVVEPECPISEIVSILKTVGKKVPVILQSLRFNWKAREIAIETGVDEYYIGDFDERFINRVKSIARIKLISSMTDKRCQSSESPIFWFLKRSFDIIISVLIVVAMLPALLVILLTASFEKKGRLLSSAKRIGKNYRVFNIYKFGLHPSGLGRIVRAFHLEWFPQILNVLAGDMSLIGNCPLDPAEAEKWTSDGNAWRFHAPAGIIGLWRFNVDGNTNGRDRANLDLEYAQANSIWLDIKIIWYCVMSFMVGKRRTHERELAFHHATLVARH